MTTDRNISLEPYLPGGKRTVDVDDRDPSIGPIEQSLQTGHTTGRKRQTLERRVSGRTLQMITAGIAVLICLLPCPAASLENKIELQQGSPGSFILTFPWTPDDDSSSYFTVALLPDQPFYTSVHQSLDPDGLQSKSQFDRFTLSNMKTESGMQVTIGITIVSSEDGGVYTVTLILYRDGIYDSSLIFRTKVEVYHPIGKANCTLEEHDRVVYCRATDGKNATLMCHQNGVKLPWQKEMFNDGYFIHGWFLNQLKNSSVFCCAQANNTEIDVDTCKDFFWPPQVPTEQNSQVTPPKESLPVTTDEPGQKYLNGTCKCSSDNEKPKLAVILIGLCVYFVVQHMMSEFI
ncbi:uncharacterized protein [Diadema setosum]|uniref:uncharacterized protein n=1 Tax=Diadema setosum TaxID=31175 RepID=UPI003B3AA9DB